ncbi:hypothetical protein AB0A70_06730 [Streptomyces morookaense]|uniref:hypothetical protein n=1 Tax=Streptomyces morookaense TaxID=1970 RepID=UPI0033D3B589
MTRRKPVEIETVERPEIVLNVQNGRLSDTDLDRIREAGYDSIARQSETYDELANSIPIVREKMQLVGAPFVSLEWRFNRGDNGEFVSATVMTQDNRLSILNDGSSGIYRQYRELTEKRGSQRGPIMHRDGLSISEYWFNPDTRETAKNRPDDGGDWRKATTFYLT